MDELRASTANPQNVPKTMLMVFYYSLGTVTGELVCTWKHLGNGPRCPSGKDGDTKAIKPFRR